MSYLPVVLIIIFIISLIFNYLSLNSKSSAIEIVNQMGLGYNLGNLFDCYNTTKQINEPNDQITLCGNQPPTKEMIIKIKKNGFKTIRFPVTWMHFIDEDGKVKSEWMLRVKEVVDWIIDSNLFCILNVHNDGINGNWLFQGMKMLNKYKNLWTEISKEFKNYDEHLIFESMKEIEFVSGDYDLYTSTVFNFTQAFVDTVRSSGGYNSNRLLLISGIRLNIDFTLSSGYKMPIDPVNKLAISILYYYPYQFALIYDDDPWKYELEDGQIYVVTPFQVWGSDNDYNEMISYFEKMKNAFVDKGIPVIISESGIITEKSKEIISIREYLYTLFSLTNDYDGIMACLWDTSKKNAGDTNYYNREKNEWYDDKIKNNFLKISKRKNIKPIEYYSMTNTKTITSIDNDGNMNMKIENGRILKVIFNVKFNSSFNSDLTFSIVSYNNIGDYSILYFKQKDGKRQYDGSYTFIVDPTGKDFNTFIWLYNWFQKDLIIFNSLTIEYQENFLDFNYMSYKSAISKFIK